MIKFRCPNCKLYIDLEISFKKELYPMCGVLLYKCINKKPLIIDKQY